MDIQPVVHIDFKIKVSTERISIRKNILYRFFHSIGHISTNHQPFNLGRLVGPLIDYNKDNLHHEDLIGVTFIVADNDDKPFVLCLEKSDKRKFYYALANKNTITWSQISELNEINEELQDKLLLGCLKNAFFSYYSSVLKINELVLANLSTFHDDIKYEIKPEIYFCNGFDRYRIKPNGPHALKEIKVNGTPLKFDQSLHLVNEITMYYATSDGTTPMLIETKDYVIGDGFALYNYYMPKYVYENVWTGVPCATNLTSPKCKSDIRRILNSIVDEFLSFPVEVRISEYEYAGYITHNIQFNSISFRFEHQLCLNHGVNSYAPKATSYFLIHKLFINNVEQKLEAQSKEISMVYAFYRPSDGPQIVMICFLLYRKSNAKLSRFQWYKRDDQIENKWVRIDFTADPENDHYQVDQKIDELHNCVFRNPKLSFFVSYILALTLGMLIGTFVGSKLSFKLTRILSSCLKLLRG